MNILIVDDDRRQRELLEEIFTEAGLHATACADGGEALIALEQQRFDTVITDLKMPQIGGVEVLQACRRQDPELPVIIITGHGTVASAIEAMKIGAYDYIQKPFDPDELVLVVNKALEHYRLVCKNRELTAAIVTLGKNDLIGESRPMRAVREMIARVAPLDVPVLISGETGTGKEMVARLIHRASKRSGEAFVAVNCGALNDSLLESELFGHEKGAFTGAERQKKGLFELASGGTLFLDEVNSMSEALQVKLLRVLEEKRFMRVGGDREIGCDVRVLSASNADLAREIEKKRFRSDLYYRLNVMNITLPPLRDRRDDIPELAVFFLKKLATRYGKEVRAISHEAMAVLMAHSWPGNVRELENCVSRALIMETGDTLRARSLPPDVLAAGGGVTRDAGLPVMPLAEVEKLMIKRALAETGGNKGRAARLLGIDASTLWRKMKRVSEDRNQRTEDSNR